MPVMGYGPRVCAGTRPGGQGYGSRLLKRIVAAGKISLHIGAERIADLGRCGGRQAQRGQCESHRAKKTKRDASHERAPLQRECRRATANATHPETPPRHHPTLSARAESSILRPRNVTNRARGDESGKSRDESAAGRDESGTPLDVTRVGRSASGPLPPPTCSPGRTAGFPSMCACESCSSIGTCRDTFRAWSISCGIADLVPPPRKHRHRYHGRLPRITR